MQYYEKKGVMRATREELLSIYVGAIIGQDQEITETIRTFPGHQASVSSQEVDGVDDTLVECMITHRAYRRMHDSLAIALTAPEEQIDNTIGQIEAEGGLREWGTPPVLRIVKGFQ